MHTDPIQHARFDPEPEDADPVVSAEELRTRDTVYFVWLLDLSPVTLEPGFEQRILALCKDTWQLRFGKYFLSTLPDAAFMPEVTAAHVTFRLEDAVAWAAAEGWPEEALQPIPALCAQIWKGLVRKTRVLRELADRLGDERYWQGWLREVAG